MDIIQIYRDAYKNVSKTVSTDIPVIAKWLRLTESNLTERGLVPEKGKAIWVEPPGDGGGSVIIESREDGVFVHERYRSFQVNGNKVVIHKHVKKRVV